MSINIQYSDGIYDRSIVFRIDHPKKPEAKIFVCGLCISDIPSLDPNNVNGHYDCESCGQKVGRPEAYQQAVILRDKYFPEIIETEIFKQNT